MMDLLERQSKLLKSEVQDTGFNPVFVIVYDTQSIEGVITTLTGKSVGNDQVQDGIARFRLSNYLPTGESLIPKIKEAVATCEWIFILTGCSICPEGIYELFQYICKQNFDTPRIIVVSEDTDWRYGNERMQKLFSLGKFLNLTKK